MSLRPLVPLLALLQAVSATPAVAQDTREAPRVTVTGNVADAATGEPVPEVVVVLEPLGLTFVTDARGQFVVEDIPPGVYDLRLAHPDYDHLDGDFSVERSGEFFLEMEPTDDPYEGFVTGIVGVVTDQVSGDVIPEVVVNVPAAGHTTRTDGDGRFSLDDLAPGEHEVVFTHLGYVQRSESIGVQGGRATRVQVVLAVDAIPLSPIEVTVDTRDRHLLSIGFYQREEDGWGDFLDREDIEYWNPERLTVALTRFPGVTIIPNPQMPSRGFLAFRRMGTECIPTVYLDGIRIGGDRSPAGIDDILNPMSVAGVEVYRGTGGIPAQYSGTGASCGVVLIWLRRGG